MELLVQELCTVASSSGSTLAIAVNDGFSQLVGRLDGNQSFTFGVQCMIPPEGCFPPMRVKIVGKFYQRLGRTQAS